MRFSKENVDSWRTQGDQPATSQGSQKTLRLKLPKSLRILKRGSFKEITRMRNRFSGSQVAIYFRPSVAPKLGITVSRKYGNAVKRNRFKRLVRESFRQLAPEFPPIELVVFPQKNLEEPHFTTILSDFNRLTEHYAQSTATKSR